MCVEMTGFLAQSTGTGLQAGAAYGSAVAHNMARRYNYKQLELNADLARMQAGETLEAGYQRRGEWHRGVRSIIGKQRAAAASSGVLVGTGSAGAVESATRMGGKIGEERIRIGAARESWYMKMMALQYSTQAKMVRATKTSPFLATLAPLLGSAGSLTTSGKGMWQELSSGQNT